MKKVYFLFLVAFISTTFAANLNAQVNVTLRVDMQDEIVSGEGVHVAGSFQGWDPAGTAMTPPIIGAIYEITFQANPGDHLLYKFINGITWVDVEDVPSSCGEGNDNNRFFDVPSEDVTVDLVCFGSCLPCILPQKNITFQVDMSEETISPNGVHIAGTFNEWSASATAMTNDGSDIYIVTLQLGAGSSHEYKFINGNAWGVNGIAQEIVPMDCGVDDYSGGYNRFKTIPDHDSTYLAVCYGSCTECNSTFYSDVTFVVDMINETVDPQGVHIAGEFNGWTSDANPMSDNGDGTWEVTLNLLVGSSYQYKFINGSEWGKDEIVFGLCNVDDNREVFVPAIDTTLGTVCFGKCNICNPPEHDITFSVDMSEQILAPEGIRLAGSMQGWDTTATQLTHVGENIYEVLLPIGEGDYHEFKYINGNTWVNAEFVAEECNRNGNRWMLGPVMNSVLDTVCFNTCDACMNQLYIFDLKVMLEGPFNGNDMNTTLFDLDSLPLNQPYNVEPWNYDGGEYLTAEPGSGVVDWIYIQLRETDGDASTATPDKLLDHQAAVVLSDGTIATPDGSPNIYFTGNFTEDLYLLVYHRNHLAVMTATPITNPFGSYTYNFTDALSKAYLGGQKVLGGGMNGMIGGDSDGTGTVDENDKDINWTSEAGSAGYFGSDLNMDSHVNNPDKNDVWKPNLNLSTQVPQ